MGCDFEVDETGQGPDDRCASAGPGPETETAAEYRDGEGEAVRFAFKPQGQSTQREDGGGPDKRQPERLDVGTAWPVAENICRLGRTPDHSEWIGSHKPIEHDAGTVHDATSERARRVGTEADAFVGVALPRP